MILRIKNENGYYLGGIRITENNIDGEVEVYDKTDNISIDNYSFDDIFNTNDEQITIKIKDDKIWGSSNYENVAGVPEEYKHLIKELNSYCAVLRHYHNKNYSNCFILIENYFGHINYGKEFGYFKTHNEICKILLKNLLYSLNDNTEYDDVDRKESFERFCNSQINHILWNLEHEHNVKLDRNELTKKCYGR